MSYSTPDLDIGKASKSLLQNALCHWVRAAHQAQKISVKIHWRGALEVRGVLGEALGALGFRPKLGSEKHQNSSSPHKFAGRLISTTCA